MKWPFVLRSTHDALMAAKGMEVTMYRDAYERVNRDFAAMLAAHKDFVATVSARAMDLSAPKPPVTLPPSRERTAIDTAIDLRAGADRQMRAYLGQWAKRELRSGTSVADVAERILKGESSDEEGVPG